MYIIQNDKGEIYDGWHVYTPNQMEPIFSVNAALLVPAQAVDAVVTALERADEVVHAIPIPAPGEQHPEIARLAAHVQHLEKLRPHWAQGYTSDGQAAQAATGALQTLWDMLGATDQTQAVQKLRDLIALPAVSQKDGELVYQMRNRLGGPWNPTDADGVAALQRMPKWKGVYEFRTLQVVSSATTTAVQAECTCAYDLGVTRFNTCPGCGASK
jgi:hypothetical protein